MTSGFTKDVVVLKSNPSDKVVSFLNDLRIILDKHNAKLYTSDCELFMDNLGYVGILEDNIETVEVTDGVEVVYVSNVRNN
tara:strand:+ start:352 stop:594 length:243 start_codon:yes stop_codon:yes gene_type:complete